VRDLVVRVALERAPLKVGLSWQVVIIERAFSISLALLCDPHFNLSLKMNANSRLSR